MERLFFIAAAVLTLAAPAEAQDDRNGHMPARRAYKSELPAITIAKNVNLHFRSPEPIQFVDLSTDILIGNLPVENVVRIKVRQKKEKKSIDIIKRRDEQQKTAKNSTKEPEAVFDTIQRITETDMDYAHGQELGVVTVIGQSFMAQYRVVYRDEADGANIATNVEIAPEDMHPLEYPKIAISNFELKQHALALMSKRNGKPIRRKKDLKMTAQLNGVHTMGDYVFLDLSFLNGSNLAYDIDQLKFTIDDKKIYKATNVQSIELEPIFQLYNNPRFKKQYRNIYVFKKFTYPNNKVLNVRLIEDQISGRTINLDIRYSDILEADTF